MTRVCPPIRVSVPASLRYRSVIIRVVASACRLLSEPEISLESVQHEIDLSERFDAELVSAVSEIFNNVVIHGHHGGNSRATISMRVDVGARELRVTISERGERFDERAVAIRPDLRALPEGGLGLYIARSCVDELEYRPGPTNFWHLTKRVRPMHRFFAVTAPARGEPGVGDGGDADDSDEHDDIFED